MRNRSKRILPAKMLLVFVALVCLAYFTIRAYQGGNDINVYLFAAEHILKGENIYTFNPFNLYLYSPLFALCLSPLTIFSTSAARVIWVLLNLGLAVRIWYLLYELIDGLSQRQKLVWTFLVLVLSAGYLNHNLALGQLTVLILWLTIEGVIQVSRNNLLKGSIALALGINFKIIPLLALGYLGLRGYFKAIVYTIVGVIVSLLLPALFLGASQNMQLHREWHHAVSPTGERFAFEDNDGCQSLNALLPAFLYDFSKSNRNIPSYERDIHYPRMIIALPDGILVLIINILRILCVAIFVIAVLPSSWLKGDMSGIFRRLASRVQQDFQFPSGQDGIARPLLLWHLAFLCLVTLLVFPHQMKYSMLYFVPVGAWVFYFILRKHKTSMVRKTATALAVLLMCVLVLLGRDIVGNYVVNVMDYYHFIGFNNLIFLWILWVLHPRHLEHLPIQSVNT